MKIITKAEAKAAGLTRYFTGKPCRRGHMSDRGIDGACIECRRALEAADRAASRASRAAFITASRAAAAAERAAARHFDTED
jgi:hypothetical protein